MGTKRQLLCVVFVVCGLVAIAGACATDVTFRAYLDKTFWRPRVRYIAELADGLPKEKRNYSAYAGMGASGGRPDLQEVRKAYQDLLSGKDEGSYNALVFSEVNVGRVRDMLGGLRSANKIEADEIDLLKCKVGLRAASKQDSTALAGVQTCFESYLRQSRPVALTSEARGWLARTYYLSGKHGGAAKIYLDELASTTSNIRRERLLTSLRMLYPYDTRAAQLRKDLNEFLDTPAHALFAANLITNPNWIELASEDLSDVASQLVQDLEQHRNLFRQGAESDALALALMRAALRIGDAAAVLRYSESIAQNSIVRQSPEFVWLAGSARFLQREDTQAESYFLSLLGSGKADDRYKTFAANGLIGVYDRSRQRVRQLWAAFQAEANDREYHDDADSLGVSGWNFNVAYLLDIQLSDAELEEYLQLYSDPKTDPIVERYPRNRTATELVRYALAVRQSRHERFLEASRTYDALYMSQRATRMRQAAGLFASAQDPSFTPERHLEAQYAYGAFLADNSERVFFNDRLWHGFQMWALMPLGSERDSYETVNHHQSLPAEEVPGIREAERKFKDDQEEYWRAYQILNQVADQAGKTPLGLRAATKAIVALRRIRPDRFGRAQEIQAADTRLTNWLAKK